MKLYAILTMFILVLVFCISLVQGNTLISTANQNLYMRWTHEMNLGSGMIIKWSMDDPYFLTMEMFAPTKGYVGVGFSPTGGMTGADIVIGWVTPEGIPMLKDYHGLQNGHPIEDFQQDYELIAATERADGTSIVFRRRWDTCDEFDMAIGEDTLRLIWAWHDQDPPPFVPLQFPYHGANKRGTQSVFMKNPLSTRKFPDSVAGTGNNNEIKNWDIRVNNVRVDSSRHTYYFCKLVKFPARQGPKHILGFRPLIDDRAKQFVHHMTLYHCFVPFEPRPGSGSGPNSYLEQFVNKPEEDCFQPIYNYHNFCMAFAFTWGIGSEGEMFPDHVGIPLGDYTEQPFYFKFEIHYDNPQEHSFQDNSGLRIFYTDVLRQQDIGTLFLGHRVSPFQLIPKHQANFQTMGFCSKECTQNGINPEGVKAISVLLHSHLAGRAIKLRHIRNGIELPPIADDKHFDFNYQQFRMLKNETIIMPGDELLVECSYNTMERDQITYGGLSSNEEMCQAIMLYYPKDKLADCRSQPEINSFLEALKIQNVSGELMKVLAIPPKPKEILPDDMLLIRNAYSNNDEIIKNPFTKVQIINPPNMNNKLLGDYLHYNINWEDSQLIENIQNIWQNGNHYMFCTSSSMDMIPNYSQVAKVQKFKPFTTDNGRFGPNFFGGGCRRKGYPTNKRTTGFGYDNGTSTNNYYQPQVLITFLLAIITIRIVVNILQY